MEVIDTAKGRAQENMDFDANLLEKLDRYQQPVLHLYEWVNPSVTVGYFIDPEKFLNMEKVKECGLDLGRRITGGGIVFHLKDFAFSFFVPKTHRAYSQNTLDNYASVNRAVISAIRQFNPKIDSLRLLRHPDHPLDSDCKKFCMAHPTKYDVIIDGKKVGGAAQRKTKKGFLHHGTISLAFPDFSFLEQVLRSNRFILEGMKKSTYSLLGEQENKKTLQEAKNALKKALIVALKEHF